MSDDDRKPAGSDALDPALSLAGQIADGRQPVDSAPLSVEGVPPATLAQLKAIGRVAQLHRETADVAEDLPTGSAWGPLTIVEKIGAGEFGDIYRARDSRLDRDVALKLLRAPADMWPTPATEAIAEARLLAKVRHPNVLTVYGAESIDGRVGIWTELIEGQTLAAYLKSHGPLSVAAALPIVIDVCRALQAVHAAGLLHRDVKAQNVMRELNGRVVLMDFGTGRDVANESTAGDLSGTPLYLAPELLDGAAPTAASDVYSTAVLAFHLLTADYPVSGRTFADVRANHLLGRRQQLRDLRPAISRPLAATIERGLAEESADRFQSAADFGRALTSASATGTARRSRKLWAWTAAAVVVMAVVSTWLYVRDRGPVLLFEARDWVLVTDFENRTGDPKFDGFLEYWLSRDLATSEFVNVVPDGRIQDTLRLMKKDADVVIDQAVGQEICERDGGIRAMLAGRLEKLGQGYLLHASVVDPRGRLAEDFTEKTAFDLESLVAGTRRLSDKVRRALGERPEPIQRSDQELARVTTPKLSAVKLYSQAEREYVTMTWKPQEPVELLQRAVADDPQFAVAYSLLAILQLEARAPRTVYMASAKRGRDLAGNSSERERYLIDARYQTLAGKYDAAIASYEALIDKYPDDFVAVRDLWILYERQGRPEKAAPLNVRLAELRPNDPEANARAAQSYLDLGQEKLARELIVRIAELPARPNEATTAYAIGWAQTYELRTAWLRDDIEAVKHDLDRFEQTSTLRGLPAFDNQMGWLFAVLGQFQKATKRLLLEHEGVDWASQALAAVAFLSNADLASFQRVVRPFRDQAPSPMNTSFLERAGLISDAQPLAEAVSADGLPHGRIVLEEVALARNDVGAAGRLRSALVDYNCTHPACFMAAEALANHYERLNDIRSAIGVLELKSGLRSALWGPIGASGSCAFWLRSQALLAHLYRKDGQIEKATKIENQLRRLLKYADSDHPILRQLELEASNRGPR